ncbi:MAG: response regulator, partial [bacterium]|nr:response regulator [bacterium]
MPVRSVLIVDDHLPSVELLEAYLLPEGYRIEKAQNGEEAMSQIAKNPPDLVLLDALMPRLNGYEVCRKIKDNPGTSSIPVVMVTSLKDPADRARSVAEGADDFLTKPVGRWELLARVRSLLQTRSLREQLEFYRKERTEAGEPQDLALESIVHDLKNTLTVVESNLELIEIKKMQDSQHQLDTSRHHCRILFHMIQDLAEVAKLEAGTMHLSRKPVELGDLIRQCVNEFSVASKAREKEILLDLSPELPSLVGDSHVLYRVIFNLVACAIRFTGQGGSVLVVARKEGEVLRVAVTSQGEPMPASLLAKAFNKTAYLAESGQAGRGLSLAFCKLAVEAHGGKIWAECKPGTGNRFTFELPLALSVA